MKDEKNDWFYMFFIMVVCSIPLLLPLSVALTVFAKQPLYMIMLAVPLFLIFVVWLPIAEYRWNKQFKEEYPEIAEVMKNTRRRKNK